MRTLNRLLVFSIILFIAISLFPLTVQAQDNIPEPTSLIDAIIKDVSARIGQPLSRRTLNFTYALNAYPDASLGCPVPGQTYAAGQTRGWDVVIKPFAGGAYDYRAPDQVHFWACVNGVGSNGGSGGGQIPPPTAVAPTVAPDVNVPTAQPVQPSNGQALPAPQPQLLVVSTQPTPYQEPISFVGYDGNVYISDLASLAALKASPITNDAGGNPSLSFPFYKKTITYQNFSWSPDGTKLLFRGNANIYVAASGAAVTKVATAPFQLSPAWSPDGTEVAYAVTTGQQSGLESVLQVQAVPAAGGAPRAVATITGGGGCGGGGDDPAVPLYYNEAGYEGNPHIMVWTSTGILFTSNCTGIGLSMNDLSGKTLWSVSDLGRVSVSPDRKHAVGLKFNKGNPTSLGAEIVDTVTGAVTPLTTQPGVDEFGWTPDGTQILYSTVTPGSPVTLNLQAPFASSVPNVYSTHTLPINNIGVWTVPFAGGQPVQLANTTGFTVGLLSASRNAATVAFSLITPTGALVQQINSSGAPDAIIAARPTIKLLTVASPPGPASAGLPAPLEASQPTFSSTGTFTANPVVVTPPQVLPANPTPFNSGPVSPQSSNGTLSVGGKAVVSVKKDSLNLRQQPDTNAQVIRILKAGTTVTILAGPQNNVGLNWWQVRVDDDQSVGWVADQVITDGAPEITLLPR